MPVGRAFFTYQRGFCYNIVGPGGGGGGPPTGAAGGDLAGEYPNPTVGEGKIITGGIGAEAVTGPKVAALAISAAKIAENAIETAKIAAAAVTEAKLAALSVTTAKIAAKNVTLSKLAEGATGWLIATTVEGVDPTGATDSSAGLKECIKICFEGATLNPKGALTGLSANKNLYIPPGIYLLNKAWKWNIPAFIEPEARQVGPWEVYADAGAYMVGGEGLEGENLIEVIPDTFGKSNAQFLGCRIKLGTVVAGPGCKAVALINTFALNNSFFEIARLFGNGNTAYGFYVNENEPQKIGFFNNEVHVHTITELKGAPGTGVVLNGQKVGGGIGVQGNKFLFGDIIKNKSDGVLINPENNVNNQFYCGAIESNGGRGFVDESGFNQCFIASLNTNTAKDYVRANKNAQQVSMVRINGTGTSELGVPTDFVNQNIPMGYRTVQPAFPATNEVITNTWERPATLFVTAGVGEITEVQRGGKNTKFAVKASTSATFRVLPGETIRFTYAAGAPVWTVYLENG